MSETSAQSPAVITRFAPSPTGHLHIGGARTALFCWALAQRTKRDRGDGRFLVRIEDTDRTRSDPAAVAGILEDLAWLGIGWDEGPEFDSESGAIGGDHRGIGPFFQSDRRAIYEAHFTRLIELGLAYPAFDTAEELAAKRAEAEAAKRTFIYRAPHDLDLSAAMERAKTEDHVLRFRVPSEAITVEDEVLGRVVFPYDEIDDFVIRKADGMPTYHFAVVVDDAMMGVTHVLRGQEHLNNTPKHIALQRALYVPTPLYAHMPLIFNPGGSKMSKRDKDKAAKKAAKDAGLDSIEALHERASGLAAQARGVLASITPDEYAGWLKDKSRQLPRDKVSAIADALGVELPEIDVEDFREAGYLPEVLCNFLALLGWNPGARDEQGHEIERFDMAFLTRHFSTERIGKSNAKFDREKLLAFNADTIQHRMTDEQFADAWLQWAARFDADLEAWADADPDRWFIAARAARPRSRTLRDARSAIAFAFMPDATIDYDATAVKKFLHKGDPSGIDVLRELEPVLELAQPWSPEAIDAAIHAFAEKRELGMGKVAQPLRVAMTGASVSPPLGETLALMPRASALARIGRCIGVNTPA